MDGVGRITGNVQSVAGDYALTSDPRAPSVFLDASRWENSPWHEAGGLSHRTDRTAAIIDLPDNGRKEAGEKLADAAHTSVVSRVHFTAYLVRGLGVAYRVDLNVEWVFRRKAEDEAVGSSDLA